MITNELKARELRIGNLVKGHTGKIWRLTIDMLSQIAKSKAEVSGIPLTPEILESCGFEKWKDISTYSIDFKNGNTIQVTNNEVFLGGHDACISGHGFVFEIKCLHQLQNLYFALTGTELEVKLPALL